MGSQGLHHHADPAASLKHTKQDETRHAHTISYVGIRGSESGKICAYVSTSCHYEKKDVDTKPRTIGLGSKGRVTLSTLRVP